MSKWVRTGLIFLTFDWLQKNFNQSNACKLTRSLTSCSTRIHVILLLSSNYQNSTSRIEMHILLFSLIHFKYNSFLQDTECENFRSWWKFDLQKAILVWNLAIESESSNTFFRSEVINSSIGAWKIITTHWNKNNQNYKLIHKLKLYLINIYEILENKLELQQCNPNTSF